MEPDIPPVPAPPANPRPASESNYRQLFQASLSGVALHEIILDAKGKPCDYRFLEVNPAFEQLTGLKAADLLNRTVLEVLPGTEPYWIETYGRVALSGEPVRFENYSGELHKHYLVNAFCPAPGRFATIIQDITERRQAEEAREIFVRLLGLLNQPDDLHSLIRNVVILLREWSGCDSVGIRLHDGEDYPYYETHGFDPEFVLKEKYLCARNRAGELLRDAAGNPVLECMCGNVLCERTNPKFPFFTPHGSFWSNNTTQLLASTSEADRQARTRNRCNGEGYESVALIPLRTAGTTFGLLQLNDHRTGRFTIERIHLFERLGDSLAIALAQRQAQKALQESEARLRQITENMADMIAQFDAQARFVYASPSYEKVLGYKPGELLGQPAEDTIHPEGRAEVMRDVKAMLRAGTGSVQFRHRHKDGSYRWVETTGRLLRDAGGQVSGSIVGSRDISERRDLMEKMIETQKMADLGTLAAGVAHEINSPLQIVTGGSESILRQLQRAELNLEDIARQVERINKNGWRIAHIVRSLLDYARSSQELDTLSLNTLVNDTLLLIEHQVRVWSNIDITTELAENLPDFTCDRNKITQVLINLLINARDAMPDGGAITIQTGFDSEAQKLVLSISDNGQGIPEGIRARIFEPFFTTKSPGKGTGLGLSIVMGIVQAHGGDIQVSSIAGHGATFTLRFALTPPEQPPQEALQDAIDQHIHK